MAFVINDGCVSCGACAGQCPVNAIAEGDGKYNDLMEERYGALMSYLNV